MIIRANMAQGDALKRVTSDGEPIIFSEWQDLGSSKVQRTEYTFDDIIEGRGSTGSVKGATEQLDLFALNDVSDNNESVSYQKCSWANIYLEKITS